MLTTKILKRNRGEGKTKWLIEQVIKEEDAGNINIYYVGSATGYQLFKNAYEKTLSKICSIQHFDYSKVRGKSQEDIIYITDELMNEMEHIPLSTLKAIGGRWYATIDGESVVIE